MTHLTKLPPFGMKVLAAFGEEQNGTKYAVVSREKMDATGMIWGWHWIGLHGFSQLDPEVVVDWWDIDRITT